MPSGKVQRTNVAECPLQNGGIWVETVYHLCCTVCFAKWLDVEETMGLRGLYKVAATAYWLPLPLPALAKSPLSLIQTVHCRLPSLLPKYHLEVFAEPSITLFIEKAFASTISLLAFGMLGPVLNCKACRGLTGL